MLKSIMMLAFIIMGFASPMHAQEIIEGEPSGNKLIQSEKDKKTIALFYADWCSACKILIPKLDAAVNTLEEKETLRIVKFDFSNEFTQTESAGLAGEHGLSEIYNEYSPGTGFAILVDHDVEIYEQSRLTINDTSDEISTKLKKYIKSKS